MINYEKYINDVESGQITTNEYIKLSVKRFKDFQKRTDIYFDSEKVEHVINFIGSIKHYLGEHAGKSFQLEGWQEFIIANIFGFYYKKNDLRVTRNVFLFMSRKQGKSALASALALYLLVADGEASPEIVFAANSREQAKIILDISTQFAKSLDPKEKHLNIFRNEIKFQPNNGKAKIVSSDAGKLDGMNLSSYIVDEFHEAKNSKMIDVLSSSQGMRKNPMGIIISTAGFDLQSPCKQLFDTSIEILRGVKYDDGFFSMLFTLDENDNWQDEKNWIKANPNINVTVSNEFIEKQIIKAKNNPSDETGVKTKILNLWCSSSDVWLTHDLILKNSKKIDFNEFQNSSFFVCCGVDLSSVSDLTAVTFLIYDHINNHYYFSTKYFLPNSALSEHQQKELYKKFHFEKQINITAGNVVDYDYIQTEILKINDITPIQAVFYDTYNSTQFAINATDAGVNMQPYSQSLANFNKPTKEFERLIKSGKVTIDDNEITRFCFKNVVLKFDHNSNCKPVKAANKNKIDGVISMLMALGGQLQQPKTDSTIFTF